MISKFSYFDVKMYFLPGAWFIGTIIAIMLIVGILNVSKFSLEIFGTVIFAVLSYIIGHLFQAYAHRRPERKLKDRYWDGMLPSQRMFFPNSRIINETQRATYLNICKKNNLLNNNDISHCNSNNYKYLQLLSKISAAFQKTWIQHQTESTSNRIFAAEANFQFCRGMFVVAFWSAILFLLPLLYNLVFLFLDKFNFVNFEPSNFTLLEYSLLIFGFIFNLILWRFFKWRCRGAGQGFAREVVRATIAGE